MICGQTLLLVPDTNWLRRSLDRDLGGSLGRLDAGEGFVRNALYHEIVQSTCSLPMAQEYVILQVLHVWIDVILCGELSNTDSVFLLKTFCGDATET